MPLTALGLMLACLLAGLAGFVDAIGFLHLGGLFVSFMSGNTTRLGVSLAGGSTGEAARIGLAIGLFLAGATGGSLVAGEGGPVRRAVVLLAVSLLLAGAAFLAPVAAAWSGALMVAAMGAENAVFQRRGGAGLALTYVTGALVKAGQGIAAALTGGDRAGWLPSLLLWAALLGGAVLGAWAHGEHGLAALWAPAIAAACLAPVVALATAKGHAG
jgi:uncharacterized membrane protein YoaK (UPF0700 family)